MTGSQRTWGLGPTWTRITGLWKQESHVGIANINLNLWTSLTSWDPAAAWNTWKLFDLEPTLNSMDCPALLARHKTPRTSRIWCHTRERHHEPLCKQEMFGNQNDVYEDMARSCTSPRTICCALRSKLYQLTGAKTHLSYRYHDHVDVSRSFLSMVKETRDSSEVGEAKTENGKASFFTSMKVVAWSWHLVNLGPAFVKWKHGTFQSDLRIQNSSAQQFHSRLKRKKGKKDNYKQNLRFATSSEPATLPSFRLPSNGAAEKQVLKKETMLVNERKLESVFFRAELSPHLLSLCFFFCFFCCNFQNFTDLNSSDSLKSHFLRPDLHFYTYTIFKPKGRSRAKESPRCTRCTSHE